LELGLDLSGNPLGNDLPVLVRADCVARPSRGKPVDRSGIPGLERDLGPPGRGRARLALRIVGRQPVVGQPFAATERVLLGDSGRAGRCFPGDQLGCPDEAWFPGRKARLIVSFFDLAGGEPLDARDDSRRGAVVSMIVR